MSRRLLVIDTGSNALDLAMRGQMYGWDVRYYDQPRKDGSIRRAGEGIVEKIRDYDELRAKWIDWADLIYSGADNAHYTEMLDPFRQRGYPIYGASPEAAALELNRMTGQKALEAAGIQTMPSRVFHDYDEAIAFVKKRPDRTFVSKPSGDADKAMSHVPHSSDDLVYMLGRWKTVEKYRNAARANGFILQEKKKGMELAVGGWFGPGGWSRLLCENAEYKKLMNGDLGVNTGEQGTLVRLVRKSKLADQVLYPMTKTLEKMEYVGYCDLNCIIDEKGKPWPLEFTMRDGWPLTHNIVGLQKGDPVQWMLDLVMGKDSMDAWEDMVSVSVVLTIGDYPHGHVTNKDVCGYPIYGELDEEHVHLSEIMRGSGPLLIGGKIVEDVPMYVTAGDYCVVCTANSETITGARRSVYAAVKKLRMPTPVGYRTDIAKGRMVEQLPKLQALGYLKGMTF